MKMSLKPPALVVVMARTGRVGQLSWAAAGGRSQAQSAPISNTKTSWHSFNFVGFAVPEYRERRLCGC